MRLPPLSSIYLRYPVGENRWRLALDDAVIRDQDIAAAQAHLLSALSESRPELPAGNADDSTAVLVIDGAEVRRRRAARAVPSAHYATRSGSPSAQTGAS
jgi:hypothetical protein